ncbi:MAG: YceI family protein [Cyclobacteriaceae bacterium]|nr:YceI family protein [Cyclobacteriaceae bacterium]
MTAEKTFVSFFSKASIEDIKAENTKAMSIFNSETMDIVFSIPIKEFEFDKPLMKEHFNEKYLESEKFPKATFSGKVSEFSKEISGEQNATAKGKMIIHGVSREIEVPGTIMIESGKVVVKAVFKIKLVDYSVTIPQLLWKNIAEEVEVKIDFVYKAL